MDHLLHRERCIEVERAGQHADLHLLLAHAIARQPAAIGLEAVPTDEEPDRTPQPPRSPLFGVFAIHRSERGVEPREPAREPAGGVGRPVQQHAVVRLRPRAGEAQELTRHHTARRGCAPRGLKHLVLGELLPRNAGRLAAAPVGHSKEDPMSVIPFDDRDGFIWYDGRLVPWRDAKLHVLTHGLHYASCVFEGERV